MDPPETNRLSTGWCTVWLSRWLALFRYEWGIRGMVVSARRRPDQEEHACMVPTKSKQLSRGAVNAFPIFLWILYLKTLVFRTSRDMAIWKGKYSSDRDSNLCHHLVFLVNSNASLRGAYRPELLSNFFMVPVSVSACGPVLIPISLRANFLQDSVDR